MHKSLFTHLVALEDKLQAYRDTLTSSTPSAEQRVQLAAQIDLTSRALDHYRQALEIEYVLNEDIVTPSPPQEATSRKSDITGERLNAN
jgi:hypothetical protein